MSKLKVYTPNVTRFSRRWWLGLGRDLLWVAVITLLIWVYADMEFTEDRDYVAKLQLTTGTSRSLVLLSGSEVELRFKLRGNRASLDAVQRYLADTGAVLSYDVTEAYGPGQHRIETRDILRRAAQLGKRGVSVVSTSLGYVDVRLDGTVTKRVPVQFQHTGATLAAPVRIEPATVSIRLAESRWAQIEQDAVIRTVQKDLSNVPDDRPFPVDLIREINGVPVEPTPASVQVTVRVSKRTVTKRLRVAVRAIVPYTWLEDGTLARYALQRKNPAEWVQEIAVSVPEDQADELTAEKVDAYVTLTEDARSPAAVAGATFLEQTVQFRFPDGLDVRLVSEPPTLQYKLVETEEP